MEQNKVHGKRILVVDDEKLTRESIVLLLKIDRHFVTEAASGQEALALLGQQPFDLVVLDFFMPGMLGGELALSIKRIAPALPILMVTAYQEKLDNAGLPVDAVIGKPFAVEDLRRTLAKLVS